MSLHDTVKGSRWVINVPAGEIVTVHAVMVDGSREKIAELTTEGQHSVTAQSGKMEVSDNAGLVTPTFSGAPGAAGGAGGSSGGGASSAELESMRTQLRNHAQSSIVHLSESEHRALTDIIEKYDSIGDFTPEDTDTGNGAYLPDSTFAAWKLARTGAVYGARVYNAEYNPGSAVVDKNLDWRFMDNVGLFHTMSTNLKVGADDYAGLHLFFWNRCNYIRTDNENVRITAIKGDAGYKESGAVDVGTFSPTLYWNYCPDKAFPAMELDDEGVETDVQRVNRDGTPMYKYKLLLISDTPYADLDAARKAELAAHGCTALYPAPPCVRADGSIAPYHCVSAFASGVASDGLLRSQPGLPIRNNLSYTTLMGEMVKKGPGYKAANAWVQTYGMIMDIIKNGTKNSQTLHEGLTNWQPQNQPVCTTSEAATWFPLSSGNASQYDVGSTVYVGTSNARDWGSTGRNIVDGAVIARKETATIKDADGNDVSCVLLHLEGAEPFRVTKVASEGNAAERIASYIIGAPANAGETDAVLGKHDGYIEGVSGRHPYRVQGVEYSMGCWMIVGNTVAIFNNGTTPVTINGVQVTPPKYSKTVWVAPRGVALSTNEATIKATYTPVGVIPAYSATSGADSYIGDVAIDPETGCMWPSVVGDMIAFFPGGSSALGHGDNLYAGGARAGGMREFLYGGAWNYGAVAGSVALIVHVDVASAGNHYAARD